MKTDRKIKAKPGSDNLSVVKKAGGSKTKRIAKSNGKHPLTTYEHAPIGIVECSPEGNHINVNEEFCRLLGYEREELIGKGIKEISHEDDYPIDIKLHQQLVEGKIPFYRLEKRYLHKNGGIIWAELTRSILRDVSGNPLYTIGVVLDISDRKHVERVLRDSSERLRLATEAARMFMWELDLQNRVYTFADNFEQVLGFSAGLLPKNSVEAVERLSPPEDVQAFWDAFAKAVESYSDLHSLQLRMINPENGEMIWLEVNAKIVYNHDGTAKRMFGVAQNITQNKWAEELERSSAANLLAIAEANAKFRTFFDQGSFFAGVMSLDGTLIEANRLCLEFCGFAREDVIGKKFWDCGWWNPSPALMEMVRTGTAQAVEGKLFRQESTYFTADGTERVVDLIIAPVTDETGQLLFLAPTGTDITERKRVEQILKESVRRQEALYHFVDRLHRVSSFEEVFDAALDAILSALQCDRASILLFDDKDVMRFVAWRGLSDGYRKATDGHSPWKTDEKNPEPICMNDVSTADLSDSLKAVIQSEGMGALAFIPLVSNGKLIGKFMTYYNAPHVFSEDETELSLTIARQLAFGVERQRAEEKIRQSEERFRQAASASGALVYEVDLPSGSTAVVHGMKSLVGYDPQQTEASSDWWHSLIHPEDLPAHLLQLNELLAKGDTDVCEYRVQHKNSGWIFVQDNRLVIRDEKGQSLRLIGAVIDITGRKRSEEALRQAAAFDETVMSNMGEGLYTVDNEGKVTSMNPAAEKMFGWRFDELRGYRMHNMTHYKHPDGSPFPAEECAGFQVLHHGQKLVGYEDVFIRKDGTFFDVVYSSSPRWDNGKINGLVVVFSDNTTRKQAEKQLVLLSEISEFVRNLEDPNELLFAVSKAVGEHLQVKRCLFNEIDVENDREIVHRDYVNGVESVAGVYKISDYSSITSAEMKAGKTVVNYDSKADPRTAADYERSYVKYGERAYVAIPLMRENRWVGSLWLSDDRPRAWSQEQVSLLETIAERTWIAVEKLRVDKALHASEELYRTIARSIPGGGIYVVDKDMRYIVADGPVTEAFGLSPEMLEGRTVSEVFPGEQSARMIERLKRNFTGETLSYETEHNGRVYWTQQAPLSDSIGEAIIVTLDITERKHIEEALRESERKFSLIYNKLPFAAALSRPSDGVIVDVNEAFERVFGYMREDVINKTSLELNINLDSERRTSILTALQTQGFVRDFELELFTKPSGKRVFLLNLDLVSIGGEQYILQTAQDITERKQAEEALRQSEERFMQFMEHLPGLAWIKDIEGRYLYTNATAEKAFRTPRDKLYGKTDEEVFPPEVATQFTQNDERAVSGEKGIQVVETLEHEDGVLHYSLVSKFPIPGPDGNTALIGGTAFDITERKQAEDALQELNLQLENRVQNRTAELQAMNESLQDEIKERRQVELALDDSRKRLQILSQRLVEVQEEERRAIARELHDRVGQTLSALNINLIIMRDQLTPDSIERVGPRLGDSMQLVGETITLVRDVMSNLRPAVLDDYGLEAALQSHVDEFTSRYGIRVLLERPVQPVPRLGPSIEMTFLRIAQEALINIVRHAHASEVILNLRQEGDSFSMTIKDNGEGIQSWQDANRPGSHGLTIMRERAEALGGNLIVTSVPGKGTRIEVSIPIGKGDQDEARKEVSE